MDPKESFDLAPKLYDEGRPAYPDEAIDWIIRRTGITTADPLLEIGPGTGQATVKFAQRGYRVHCVERGKNLAEFLLQTGIPVAVFSNQRKTHKRLLLPFLIFILGGACAERISRGNHPPVPGTGRKYRFAIFYDCVYCEKERKTIVFCFRQIRKRRITVLCYPHPEMAIHEWLRKSLASTAGVWHLTFP